jgi:hypothetical protein
MTTFLNIELGKPIYWKFLLKHILFFLIWTSGLLIVIFRLDLYLYNSLPEDLHWTIRIIPFAFFGIVLLVMFCSKWYYNLALIFYPILLIFWFLPKLILAKGKIYLFSNYLSSIINTFKHFKYSILHFSLFIATLFLLLITDSTLIRILSVLIFSYFYYRFIIRYIRKSFNPPRLFGSDIEKAIDDIILSTEKGMFLVKAIEEQKQDEKLSEDDAKNKRIEKLILLNFFIVNFKDNLSGFNGKKAFVISWIYQLIGFFVTTLIFFTFINYELFSIDRQSFITTGQPLIFDFFYYTIKTVTFSNINDIIPSSIFAKSIEILSFLTLGVFLLIIVTSIIFSLRQDKLSENIRKATDLCVQQNEIIAQHIKSKYQTDIQSILNESSQIRTSLENIKIVIQKLF